jgi:short chain dehydrogenase
MERDKVAKTQAKRGSPRRKPRRWSQKVTDTSDAMDSGTVVTLRNPARIPAVHRHEPDRLPPIAVVTGASAGIGRATAREFAGRGCYVAIIARNTSRLAAAADELRRQGVRALPITADVAEAGAIDAAADRIEAELGPIGIWVNNADGDDLRAFRSHHRQGIPARYRSHISRPGAWHNGRAAAHAGTRPRYNH